MDTSVEKNESKDFKTEQRKSWFYIIIFMFVFLLIGTCIKWISSAFHGLH